MNDDPPHEDWLDESDLDIDGAVGLPDPDPTFRAQLLARTRARVRHRRQTRLLVQAAALLIAFSGGMAFTQFVVRAPAVQVPPQLAEGTHPNAETPQPSTPAPNETIFTNVTSDFSAELLRDPEALTFRYNEATPEEQLRLLKAAGDHYFYREGGFDLAANFYRRYIEGIGNDAEFYFAEPPNWLFASISTALQEETQDDTPS